MQVVERIKSGPALASITDTQTMQRQQEFLEGWRQAELELAQLASGPMRAECLRQVRRLEKEIARNNRFLASRGVSSDRHRSSAGARTADAAEV